MIIDQESSAHLKEHLNFYGTEFSLAPRKLNGVVHILNGVGWVD